MAFERVGEGDTYIDSSSIVHSFSFDSGSFTTVVAALILLLHLLLQLQRLDYFM